MQKIIIKFNTYVYCDGTLLFFHVPIETKICKKLGICIMQSYIIKYILNHVLKQIIRHFVNINLLLYD